MKTLFGIGLVAEGTAILYFLYQAWIVFSGRSTYLEESYPDLYRENLVPAAILILIFSGALLARFYFNKPAIATYIVLSPVFIAILAGVAMVISSVFIKDWK